MSFSDPPPPFFPSPLPGGEGVGFWPQVSMNNEASDPRLQFQEPLPSKRPRNDDENSPNSMSNPRMNQRLYPSNPPVSKGAANIFFKTRICSKFMVGTCRNGENCKFAHGDDDIRKPPNNWQAIVSGQTEDCFPGNWENDEKIIQRMKLCKKFYNGEECPYGERCNFLHEDPSKFRNDIGRYRESSVINVGQRERESSAISLGHGESSAVSFGHRERESSAIGFGHRESSAISIERVDNPGNTVGYQETSVISIGTTETSLPHGSGSDRLECARAVTVGLDSSRVKPLFWKTKLCTKFQITGQCPYGDKCHYAHGPEDLQAPGGGGRASGEAGTAINNGSTRPPPFARNEFLLSKGNVAADTAAELEENGEKCFLKWKLGKRKINGIYGDWIDGVPLMKN